MQLLAESSQGQTYTLHSSASAIPANVRLDSSPAAAAMPVPSDLPQEAVTQAEDVHSKLDRQAVPLEVSDHQHDQVHSLMSPLPGRPLYCYLYTLLQQAQDF